MPESTMQIKIPEELITNTIRAEMVKHLGGLEEVAKQVVIAALEQPVLDSYGRPKTTRKMVNGRAHDVPVNRFEERVTEMLQKEAEKVFSEWLDQHRDALHKALHDYLTRSKSKVLKGLCEGLVADMSRFTVRASLALTEKDRD